MEIHIKHTKAVCPICSGLVTELMLNKLYRCMDCKTLLEVVGNGYAEDALEVETRIT
jgi:hypothetical protein